jgi:CheY-like chemotaxis protein
MPQQATFLVVEDDLDDVTLLRRAFTKAKILNTVHFVRTGEEAVAYLTGVGRYSNRAEYPIPALILLDLKMPGMGGHEFLGWLRAKLEFRALRVVVLSSSDDMRDVNLAYQLGANSFLIKPADFDRFVEISQALSGYWIWMDKAATAEAAQSGDTEVIRRGADKLIVEG